MTLVYEPGRTVVHRLDPRSKLAVQITFVIAAFAYTTPRGLAFLTLTTAGILLVARTSPFRLVYEFRFVLPFVIAAPVLQGLTLGAPWFVPEHALAPALASYRILLVLCVTGVYIRTTPVRASRAALQWAVPGRPGQFLGMGGSFVFRFLPVLQSDLGRIRDAHRARLGTERPVRERVRLVTIAGFNRAFERADRFALALQARCFSWNPTLPPLRFSRLDIPAIVLSASFLVAALLTL